VGDVKEEVLLLVSIVMEILKEKV
jgi:hypothetical protein